MASNNDIDVSDNQMEFLDLLSRLNQEKNLAIYCRDNIDPDITTEQKHCQQVQRFLQTAKQDAHTCKEAADGSEYVLLALIAKDMLKRCPQNGLADMMTGITLVFRSLTPIPIDEVGMSYRQDLNCSIYNMRNKLLCDYYYDRGIWALVNNSIAANKQYDKIPYIKREIQFRIDDPPRHDIYLLKTTNFVKYAPSHYILLINKYCFHLTNVGIFAGEYKRMKSRLFRTITSFEKVGTTTLDVIEIDDACQILAAQSHSVLFNNCQNYATNVYGIICEEKGVVVEFSSFSGARVIIQVLLIVIAALVITLLLFAYLLKV